MAHVALYRTYRPKDFEAVVGQQHIVRTLKNQIAGDKLAHAYIFTGPRGTGKTSIARIVAKAANCTNASHGNPCNECASCQAIVNGNHPDLIELDGASNNGVDEIRDIRDRAKYSPSLSKYKIYIIDEVHMLSIGAFNALLKTLEEPPAHVIFMLATTEIHKVPDTILSRVQRFDLKQIPTVEMTSHLTRIMDELKISYEDGVSDLVATLAGGGLRDALSILDQAIAFGVDKVTIQDLHDLNGSVDKQSLIQLIVQVSKGEFANVVATTRQLLSSGKIPARILEGLLGLLRDVLKDLQLGTNYVTELKEQLQSQQVLTYIKKLNALMADLKIATDAELILEIGLIELGLEQPVAEGQPALAQTSMPAPVMDSSVLTEVAQLKNALHDLEKELKKLKSQQFVAARRSVTTETEPVQEDLPKAALPDLKIEDILEHATKQAKNLLSQKVAAINPFEDLAIKEMVMLLKDAEIIAASEEGCILGYPYETTAQKLFKPQTKTKIIEILSQLMGRPFRFIALPKGFWQTTRQSYLQQKKAGGPIQLEQYVQVSQENPVEREAVKEEPPFYQDALDMFGELVEIHD